VTTFVRRRRNDNVLIGFFVVVLVAVTVRAAMSASTVVAVIAALLAAGLIGLAVWLRGRPPQEIRVSPSEIVYVADGRVAARIGHAEAGGRVMVHTEIHRGHAWYSLVDADRKTGASMPLDGFNLLEDGFAAACVEHGWQLVS
jgi:hypothetical protein